MNELTNASKKIGDLFAAGARHIDLHCACCEAHLDGRTANQWHVMANVYRNAFAARVELGKATIVALVK